MNQSDQKPDVPHGRSEPFGPRSLKVLLVDDDPISQQLVRIYLQERGYQITVAEDGPSGVKAILGGRFDLVLMDVRMPELSGWDATRRVRAAERESGGHIPIIALTAYAMKGDAEKCRQAGMDGYVTKPVSSQALFREIERVMTALDDKGNQ